jgi:hypothetical protein
MPSPRRRILVHVTSSRTGLLLMPLGLDCRNPPVMHFALK